MNAEFQRIVRRVKKAFLSDQCKEIEENNRMGKIRDLFKKIINRIEQIGVALTGWNFVVTNRLRGLDLMDRVPEELWMEVHDIVQEAVIKTIPKKKKCIK